LRPGLYTVFFKRPPTLFQEGMRGFHDQLKIWPSPPTHVVETKPQLHLITDDMGYIRRFDGDNSGAQELVTMALANLLQTSYPRKVPIGQWSWPHHDG
jgi:hypothetical protein